MQILDPCGLEVWSIVLRVDGDSPEVEPRQQDDDRAKRATDVRVTVEEVQLGSQAKREEQLTAGERVRAFLSLSSSSPGAQVAELKFEHGSACEVRLSVTSIPIWRFSVKPEFLPATSAFLGTNTLELAVG